MHVHSRTPLPDPAERPPETRGRTIHWAGRYDLVVRLLTLGQDRTLRRISVELARIQPGEAVLDVGCGTGDLTLAAAAAVGTSGRVCGIDASPEMIQVASRKAARSGRAVEFRLEPIEKMSFSDGSFDVVISSLMMHHLPEDVKRAALAEVYRVLKPGGRLYVLDLSRPDGMVDHVLAHITMHGGMVQGVQDLAPVARAAGFTTVDTGKTRFPMMGFMRARREG